MKIKKGDKVKIIAGKDKGKEGIVQRSFPQSERLLVEGVNIVKRHRKQGSGDGGGIVDEERSIHVSNVKKV